MRTTQTPAVIARALLFALCATVPVATAFAEHRVALVVGNAAYRNAPELKNPINDAVGMAASLEQHGFKVIKGLDLDKAGMDRAVRDFAAALSGADVGLFFYAGHGLQVAGSNYLVPVDAQLASAAALDFETVRLELVQRSMEREAATNLLFLDACRDNPLARNLARGMGTRSAEIGRGLAAAESGVGTLISFSTQPGNVALDGAGGNSPFAAALLKAVGTPGEDLSSLLIRVRNDVMAATGNRQVPWEHSALRARFYFVPAQSAEKSVVLQTPSRPQRPPGSEEARESSGKPALGSPTTSDCPDNFAAFADSTERLACTCSAEATQGGYVRGMDAYTPNSSICRAALHAGVITKAGGPVTVIPDAGRKSYPGVTRNNVTSYNHEKTESSFRFTTLPAISDCPDNFLAFADSAERLACTCSAEAAQRGYVRGMDVYTSNSSICRAALHAGVIGKAGGSVTVISDAGRKSYPGVTRNGVTSYNDAVSELSFRFARPN